MSDSFDESSLMDRVDGDVEFLEETIAMLDEDSPALLDQIRHPYPGWHTARPLAAVVLPVNILGIFQRRQIHA